MTLSSVIQAAVWSAVFAGVGEGRTDAAIEFSRDIRPILSDKCFACHGPDAQKVKGGLRLDIRDSALRPGKSGRLALVPGRPLESELVRRITTSDEDDQMPPSSSHKKLSATEKASLTQWIASGAEYQVHWAYARPAKPQVPAKGHPVDYLVGQRLQLVGLSRVPEADRRTLARRLHQDLLGLPAKPDDVEAFEKDDRPEAYRLLVERLLASPHHGERMAVGWLDVARFADTIGYHSDNPRPIWPYRDYVIRAFNDNKPFDQFTREQLAGDLLPAPTLDQKVASGFNRLLLTTEEGGAQPKDYEARYLTDRVRAVGTIWLGQTVGCAQCHDHKFDPITMRDFYSLGAFFADIQEPAIGSRGAGMLVPDETQALELARLQEIVTTRQAAFDGPHPQLEPAFAVWQKEQQAALDADARWTRLTPSTVLSEGGATLKVREDQSVLVSGKAPDTDTYTLRFTNGVLNAAGLRIEALPDDSLPSKGPGRGSDGSFVLTELSARIEKPGVESLGIGLSFARATLEQQDSAKDGPGQLRGAAAVIDGDADGSQKGWAILSEPGRAQHLVLGFEKGVTLASGETLVLEIRHRHGDQHQTLGCFRVAVSGDQDTVTTPVSVPPSREIAAILRVPLEQREVEQRNRLLAHFKQETPELAAMRRQLAVARKALAEYEARIPRSLVTERLDPPRTVRILPRGNFLVESGDLVEPAFPAFLVRSQPGAEGRRLNRLDLADWLVSPDHPLTARVVMNRLWKQFFGTSLSKVMDDFGAQGEPPLNADLLDWLACEFIDNGWNLRHMVRLLVTCDTYRQQSTAPRELQGRDPENREFARQGRWRLDAEFVRDQALTFAGLLVPTLGGPSVRPYQPEGYWENLNFPVRTYEASAGLDQYRRGLYIWWQRSFLHPSLLAFDAPTREECTADRPRSNIPQQALVLLNDPTYVEAARAFALRMLRECPGEVAARLSWGWRQALARPPRPEELRVLTGLLQKHLAAYRQAPEAAAAYLKVGAIASPGEVDPVELAAWTNVARAMLSLHETLTRS